MTGTAVLARYHLLGRTGLRVSPLALGAMTFGEGGWHAGEDTARSLFRRYLEAGGNFVDTAINYGDGRSEELLGTFMKETGSRQRMVVATKFTFPAVPVTRTPAETGARTCCLPWRHPCAACNRTTWTCTGCTPGTG